MTIKLTPFAAEHLPAAGDLLARRHIRDRTSLPHLPSRFEDASTATNAVSTVMQHPQSSGVAAIDAGQLVGYLIGDLQINETWGRSAWVRSAGCAIDPHASTDLVYRMYAALGEQWVTRDGCFNHFVMTPLADPTLTHAWFLLGFGVQQVHALMRVPDTPTEPSNPAGITIRRAHAGDHDALREFSDIIWRHQLQAPIWAIMLPEHVADQREGWAELPTEPDAAVFLALEHDQVVGVQAYYLAQESSDNLVIGANYAHLSVAGTREAARGRGVQQALFQHSLAWMRENNIKCCETDWRSANLHAASTWQKLGFNPVMLRLARRIDPRISWAKGGGY